MMMMMMMIVMLMMMMMMRIKHKKLIKNALWPVQTPNFS